MKTNFVTTDIHFYALGMLLLASLGGCKKDSGTTPAQPTNTPAQPTAVFPKKTEWTGTLDGSGFQYRMPCCLKFNNDDTFTMYGAFTFFPNGVETPKDSITGTVAATDALPDGRIRITTDIITSFNGKATKYIYITDKQKIQGVTADNTLETFQLALFAKEASVGGSWSGPAWKTGIAYPDVSIITFVPNPNGAGVTQYTLNGTGIRNAADPASGTLGVIYKQIGSRVYFSGYRVDLSTPGYGGVTVPYFGVLMPTGDKMMVHSRNSKAQLPNYVNTNEPYGPNGATPVIIKK